MKRYSNILPVLVVLLAAISLVAAGPRGWQSEDDDGEEIPFSVATIYFELNDTDGDLGIHALIDGEGWRVLEMESPDEREKLRIVARGSMRRQGLTELFFESAEPPFDELDPSVFFRRFKEGMWEVSGITIDGEELESEALVSHVMAAPAENILVSGMAVPEDCDEGPVPAVSADMPITVSWDHVTESHPEIGAQGPIEVVLYQLVLEREEPEPLKFAIDLPPSVNEVQIPHGLFNEGDEIKVEVLVREATGNQTAVESCFEIE